MQTILRQFLIVARHVLYTVLPTVRYGMVAAFLVADLFLTMPHAYA